MRPMLRPHLVAVAEACTTRVCTLNNKNKVFVMDGSHSWFGYGVIRGVIFHVLGTIDLFHVRNYPNTFWQTGSRVKYRTIFNAHSLDGDSRFALHVREMMSECYSFSWVGTPYYRGWLKCSMWHVFCYWGMITMYDKYNWKPLTPLNYIPALPILYERSLQSILVWQISI